MFEIVPREKLITRVQVTAVGYRPGEAYDDLFQRFRLGDAYTLEKLRAHFDKTAATSPTDSKSPKKPQLPKKVE